MAKKMIKITLIMIFSGLSFSLLAQQEQQLKTISVKSESIQQLIYLDGQVEAVQQATLFAQTSGRVIKLTYDVDDFVSKGSVIARLRNTEQKARFKQAKAGLDAAQSTADEALQEYKRVSDLYARQLLSASSRDKADAALKTAKAQLNAAKARFDEAKEQLDHTVIRAPFSGTLTKRHIELGETLQIGQPIVSGVAQQDALRFNVQVPQRLIEQARQLSTVEVLLDDGSQIVSDQITIFPTADVKTHSFQLRALVFSNLHRLYPGMFIKVGLNIGDKKQILVPVSSIVNRGELTAVYVQDAEKRLHLRQVRPGRVHGDKQVILAGLEDGEILLADPHLAAVAIKAQSKVQAQGE